MKDVRPSEQKTMVIARYPVPDTRRQMQSFLGLASYFRKYIPDYSKIAKPLADLFRGDQLFVMGEGQMKAFTTLKRLLSEIPVLALYDPEAETELHSDTSKHCFGSVLLQKDCMDGKLHSVYYFSRKTSKNEEKWSSYELSSF